MVRHSLLQRWTGKPRQVARALCAVGLVVAFVAMAGRHAVDAQSRGEIVVNDTHVFPESLTSSEDGAVFFGSVSKGIVYRAAPGAPRAEPWIAAGTGGLGRILGVLADDRRQTLWVCSVGAPPGTPAGAPPPVTSVKAFALDTGAFKSSHPFSGGGSCNDMAVAADGTVYATDFNGGRVMRLTQGATAFDVWSADAALAAADGIVVLADGAVYVNTYWTGTLVRLSVGADGSAGKPVRIDTSRPLVGPDGMRAIGAMTLLVVETEGRLSEVVVHGDRATVRLVKDGLSGLTGVTLVGDVAFVAEGKLHYRRDPKLKNEDPGQFRAIAVPYTRTP